MKNRFYLACLRETVGTNMSFWCHDGHGYSTNIDKANTYTLEEAQSAWNRGRSIDLPVDADVVDAHAVYHVDHQHVPGKTIMETGCNQYVGFVKGQWDGNDLYFLSDVGTSTTDFRKAASFSQPKPYPEEIIWLPFHIADAAKRRTFNIHLLNRRTMIQGAGLRMPDWLKKEKRRKPSGKTRWNCPHCGRISWQDHPYHFDGCLNMFCEGWSA